MQRRIRPNKLQENFYGTLFPKPRERVVDMSMLDGGLNLWQLPYRLNPNQSPDLLNVYWRDGCLKSRPGQRFIYHAAENDIYGYFYGCYERYWQGYIIAHKGENLFRINPSTGEHVQLYNGLAETKGAGFFVFNDDLYYLGGGKYIKIDDQLIATEVTGFIPTVVMNMKPSGIGGTSYQPENRIASGKTVLFTSDGTSRDYHLPYTDLDSATVEVKVNTYNSTTQTYSWITRTDVTVNVSTGVVTFATAPAQTDPETANNVSITCYKTNEEARDNILSCTCLSVYGGNTDLAVVLGGCTAQPNAYFWSGNTDKSIDPTYFPMDYYNLAGADAENKIVGFGRQQGLLIIFQDHSVGKTTFGDEAILDRTYLTLNYTNINAYIGCDVPGSIQLVDNNLVFANTYGGVYVLANTTPADENNLRRISLNVNGTETKGLFADLQASEVASFDDSERYWLMLNGHAYLWDYTSRSYLANEENLSWFYFENIRAVGIFQNEAGEHFYFRKDGSIVEFTPNSLNDFGEAIMRKYVFAVQYFGTYEVLKDVMKLVVAVRSDTHSIMHLSYQTDWETREDRTPIDVAPPNLTLVPYDFTNGYNFRVSVYAYPTVRIPRCFHVRHFGLTIYNEDIDSDIGIVSAQIFYRYVREIR